MTLLAAALAIGAAGTASAQTVQGSKSCAANHRVSAASTLSASGSGAQTTIHTYTAGGSSQSYTHTGLSAWRSYSPWQSSSYTLSSARNFYSWSVGCANLGS